LVKKGHFNFGLTGYKISLVKIAKYAIILPYQGNTMAEVQIATREDFEKALRKFMMQCKRESIVKNFRERQHYTKPSQKRREKRKKCL